MTSRDMGRSESPSRDADEALASTYARLADYVIVEPRDTSFPVPVFGLLSKPSRVRVVERTTSTEQDRDRALERVGRYFWSILTPAKDLKNSKE